MKNAICFLPLLLSPFLAFGQPVPGTGTLRLLGIWADPYRNMSEQEQLEHRGIPFDPYRKVGETYYDLRPIYTWMTTNANWPHLDASLQKWIGFGYGYPLTDLANDDGTRYSRTSLNGPFYEVVQVLDDGLLVHETTHDIIGDEFFLTNYPSYKHLVDNQAIKFIAVRSGNYQYIDTEGASRTVPFYDCGIPVTYEELDKALHLTEKAAAQAAVQAAAKAAADGLRLKRREEMQANAVKTYQALAEKGDAYGQLRMGEFYRDGDGVPQDAAKARDLFAKSAAQGNPEAARALDKINAITPK